MVVAGLAAVFFVNALIVHAFWWRVRLPRRQIPTLGLLFIFTLLCEVAYTVVYTPFGTMLTAWHYVHIVLFYVALTLAYIDIYPGLERRSPRMSIALLVDRAEPNGLTREDLHRVFGAEPPLDIRIKALVDDRMLCEEDDRYCLTAKGRFFGWFFAYGQDLARLQRRT